MARKKSPEFVFHKMQTRGEYRPVSTQILRWRKAGKKKFQAELKAKDKNYCPKAKEVQSRPMKIRNIFMPDGEDES